MNDKQKIKELEKENQKLKIQIAQLFDTLTHKNINLIGQRNYVKDLKLELKRSKQRNRTCDCNSRKQLKQISQLKKQLKEQNEHIQQMGRDEEDLKSQLKQQRKKIEDTIKKNKKHWKADTCSITCSECGKDFECQNDGYIAIEIIEKELQNLLKDIKDGMKE